MGSYSIVAILLLVVCALQQAAAFTSSSSSTMVVRTTATPPAPQYRPTGVHPAFTATAFSATALQLKVKIDPDKANKNEKGNNAMAAYGGSIAIAALFPVLFIIWSLVK